MYVIGIVCKIATCKKPGMRLCSATRCKSLICPNQICTFEAKIFVGQTAQIKSDWMKIFCKDGIDFQWDLDLDFD